MLTIFSLLPIAFLGLLPYNARTDFRIADQNAKCVIEVILNCITPKYLTDTWSENSKPQFLREFTYDLNGNLIGIKWVSNPAISAEELFTTFDCMKNQPPLSIDFYVDHLPNEKWKESDKNGLLNFYYDLGEIPIMIRNIYTIEKCNQIAKDLSKTASFTWADYLNRCIDNLNTTANKNDSLRLYITWEDIIAHKEKFNNSESTRTKYITDLEIEMANRKTIRSFDSLVNYTIPNLHEKIKFIAPDGAEHKTISNDDVISGYYLFPDQSIIAYRTGASNDQYSIFEELLTQWNQVNNNLQWDYVYQSVDVEKVYESVHIRCSNGRHLLCHVIFRNGTEIMIKEGENSQTDYRAVAREMKYN